MLNERNVTTPTAEERLRVYKEVLAFIEVDGNHNKKWDLEYHNGLCLLIPCAWLGCHVMDSWHDTEGEKFSLWDVSDYFPEFGFYYTDSHNYMYTREYRIKILKEIIASMTSTN